MQNYVAIRVNEDIFLIILSAMIVLVIFYGVFGAIFRMAF